MKTAEQILRHLLELIGHIYERPLMYGGSVDGVETLLSCLHALWADIVERREEFEEISMALHEERGCGAMSLADCYRREINPGCAEREVLDYVVAQWRALDERLDLEVPPGPHI